MGAFQPGPGLSLEWVRPALVGEIAAGVLDRPVAVRALALRRARPQQGWAAGLPKGRFLLAGFQVQPTEVYGAVLGYVQAAERRSYDTRRDGE